MEHFPLLKVWQHNTKDAYKSQYKIAHKMVQHQYTNKLVPNSQNLPYKPKTNSN